MNQIQADRKLKGRILFESVPSGHRWLHAITDAMRNNQVLSIAYQAFGKLEPCRFDIEPYYLKVVKRRWYVSLAIPITLPEVGIRRESDQSEDVFMLYALDRISDCSPMGATFRMKEDFDIDEYFHGCCGIMRSQEEPVRILLKAYYSLQTTYALFLFMNHSANWLI